MSSSAVQSMAQTINERSRTLINNDLKRICKEEGTSQTGNKAALQARVQGRMCAPLHPHQLMPFFRPVADLAFTSRYICHHEGRHRNATSPALPRPEPRRHAPVLSSSSQQ